MQALAVTVTSPDGTQVNATVIPCLSGEEPNLATNDASPLDSGSNGPIVSFTAPVPSGISSTMLPFYFQNSNMLMGFFIYWNSGFAATAGLIMAILGAIGAAAGFLTGGASLIVVGIVTAWLGVVLALSQDFPALVSGNAITILYYEFEFYLLFGFLPVPSYAEMGYYSNQYQIWPINSGEPVSCAWTFFDCYDTSHSFIDLILPNFLWYSHTDVWPAGVAEDSEVTFQAVDASGNQIDNVGFEVDGSWNFYSGESYWLPAGTHSVYAANPGGALHWIDQDGNGLNGCPVPVTISGDTTITAHY
jgi:hypothetical protein